MVYDPQKYDYSEYSKRYYAKKKGEINAKRKTKRDQFKERMKHLEERVARCIVEMEEDDSPQPEYERRNGKPFLPLATVLAGFEISGYFETAGNRKKNKSDIKTAWRLLGEPVDFYPLFSRLVQVRTAFENGKQLADPTQKYSLSSQLGMVQAFTNITNVFKDLDLPPETMRDLNRLYKLYKLRADRREIEQFTNNKEPILSYPEYLAAVLEKYKRPSREFLIASLYSEFPARDNFGMTVTGSLTEAENDKTKNWIVIPQGRSIACTAVLHEFKTKGKYDTIKKEFSDNVSRLIRAWKSEKKIKNGDLLLPRKLSSIISKMNSALEVDLGGGGSVGVNWIRHSVASTAAANVNMSDDDLLDLIMLFGHKTSTFFQQYVMPLMD